MPVTAVADDAAFKKRLDSASVGCVLFHADWCPGAFTVADLAPLADRFKDVAEFVSVDCATDDGEEIAFRFDVGQKLPVVAFTSSGAKGELLVGTACTVDAVERQLIRSKSIVKQQAAAKNQGAAQGGTQSVHDMVRSAYGTTAAGGASVLPGDVGDPHKRRELLGYGEGDINESADLGLGCGNPISVAKLKPGEVVVDLGSGAGIDCFLAAKHVGNAGHVIGVDMTPEMLKKARENAAKDGYANVSFRLGEIEHLPVGDGTANCVISNCVINLSPDKSQVYREMNRILKPGGRVAISDVQRTSEIPEALKTAQSYACWVGGASAEDEMRDMLRASGFENINIDVKENAADIIKAWMPGSDAEKYVTSVYVTAWKPTQGAQLRDDVKQGIATNEPVFAAATGDAATDAGCWG